MIFNKLLGMIQSAAATRDTAPPAPPPRMILGGNTAPELCMLPKDGTAAAIGAMTEKRVVQVKGDGIHGIYTGGRIYTREGTPMDCALHCQPALRRMEDAIGHEMMIDGEFIVEEGFNATVAAFKRGQPGEGVFWTFDALPNGAWITGGSERPIEERLAVLRAAVLDHSDSPFVGMLDYWFLNGQDTVAKAAELWAEGYEGIVTKRAGSPYVRARSDDWLRLKRTITLDLPIMDIVVAADGALRKVMVRGPEGVGPIALGKGWSPAEAKIIAAANGSQSVGMLVEVSFQLTTGSKRSVRGATWHRLRADRGVRA